MTAAATGTRFLVVAASLLLAGCGGGDGDSDDDAAKIDRSGYFTKEQSESINPSLAVYDTAFRELDSKHDACSKTTTRLFNAGKDARVAVKCHLDQTGAVVEALGDVDAAFGEIDGSDFRAACTKQLAATRTFVTDYRDSWSAVLKDWEAYADGKAVSTPAVQKHFDDAYAKGSTFVTDVIGDLTTDCYTKADRTTANADAKDEAKDDA